MNSFDDYQAVAGRVPLALRNNRDRIDLPVRGLQEEAGRIGSLMDEAFASGQLVLTPAQRAELQDRLADLLWYTARLCGETDTTLQKVAAHSLAQLHERAKCLNPEQR